ncbi:Uncharacterized protein dnm_041480 [Desulfonema magnum]|uniref:Uncharacterized protein n=1 Tax=Desulfonema magnum TaxID=45655 RepID=A0A975GNT6_9BACT|nr:Uncharacterized protein dnm_041480 [Desulfonema magnum]
MGNLYKLTHQELLTIIFPHTFKGGKYSCHDPIFKKKEDTEKYQTAPFSLKLVTVISFVNEQNE